MFKLHEIREIIKLIDQSSIQELNLEWEGSKLSIKKNLPAQVTPQLAVAQSQPVQVQPPASVAVPPAVAAQPAPVQVETAPPAGAAAAAVEGENLHTIVAPMVGTFYRAPEPGKPPYVQPGDKVTTNTVVCILEAMKLFNEIEAEVNGEIVKVLVEDGQLVEYGQPLFLVKPE